jgi:acyl-coenzyme A synthetase/AMP-(fatty) acid ligase
MNKFREQALFVVNRPATQVVAVRREQSLSLVVFCHRVLLWRQLVQKQKGATAALYFSDTAEFAAAMLALLQEGKHVFLPSDVLPATCRMLGEDADFFVGDFPQICQPLKMQGDLWAEAVADTKTIEANHVCSLDFSMNGEIVIYTSGSTGQALAVPKSVRQFVTQSVHTAHLSSSLVYVHTSRLLYVQKGY